MTYSFIYKCFDNKKTNYLLTFYSILKSSLNNRFFVISIKFLAFLILISAILLLSNDISSAQEINIDLGEGLTLTNRVLQLVALITVLSLAPSILIMVTSFTRIVVVLSFLRTAIGTGTAPPNAVIISLALFLTSFVMWPTFETSWNNGLSPYVNGELNEEEAFNQTVQPFHQFMRNNVREKDLNLFYEIAKQEPAASPEEISLRILIPAFMISELRRAFEIGFLLFLPFLIIDLVVAAVLVSLGMMMLPPITIALPFKLIFFVLVDGWSLVAGSLVESYPL